MGALPASGGQCAVVEGAGDDVHQCVGATPLGPFGNRISYLYYMVIVLPAVYLAVARLLSHRTLPRAVLAGYVCILGYWFEALYPFRTWSGG